MSHAFEPFRAIDAFNSANKCNIRSSPAQTPIDPSVMVSERQINQIRSGTPPCGGFGIDLAQ
jgi:hypothetical protein